MVTVVVVVVLLLLLLLLLSLVVVVVVVIIVVTDLAGGFDALPQWEVHHEEDDHKAEGDGPLYVTHVPDTVRLVYLQHAASVTGEKWGQGQDGSLYFEFDTSLYSVSCYET